VPVAAPPQQVQAYVAVPVGTQTGTSGMAIAGFVLAFLCSVLGLIFSILGYKECKRSNGTLGGEGLALAGIIISIVGLAIGLIYLLAFSAALGTRL
jgi:hypothetical protein